MGGKHPEADLLTPTRAGISSEGRSGVCGKDHCKDVRPICVHRSSDERCGALLCHRVVPSKRSPG